MAYQANSENVTLKCRVCGTSNRVPVSRALDDLSAVRCGSCAHGLLRVTGQALTGIRDEDLSHPFDQDALKALRAVPLLDDLLTKLMGGSIDKLTRFNFLANAVQVDAKQAPSLWRLYLEAAGRIDVDPPPLFIIQSPVMNAYAMGSGRPMVAVTSGLIDGLEEREILGVLGHELTHVRLGHVLYRTLAILLMRGSLSMLERFLGIGRLLVMPLQLALFRWYQMAELSADRGELLATGSVDTFVRTHMLLAGGNRRFMDELDVKAFIAQANEAEQARDSDIIVYVMDLLQGANRTHPLPAWRVHHALKWAQTERFFQILAGESPSGHLEDKR